MMLFEQMTGLRRVHFVGIGGAGMCGIAEILLDYDIAVSGSDLAPSETTRRLQELGATVYQGHRAEQVEGADVVVYSSAVQGDNVEVQEARRTGVATVRRAEMLAELMRLQYGVAVAGTHGKTTTTSLTGTVLTEAGFDPTVIVGGRLRVSGTGARHGRGGYMVVEADEFDRSFLSLAPIIAVITNIDQDHLDTYENLEAIQEAFVRFAQRVPFFGQVIVCLDDAHVQTVLPALAGHRVVSYGLTPQADFVATQLRPSPEGTRYLVRHERDGDLGEVFVPMPGKHNVLNSLAAVAVGHALGVPIETIGKAIEEFGGVHRRFERLGERNGASVIDDYAHHPTEVEATLRAVRDVHEGRVAAIFQPHLYSRTRDHAADFASALLFADLALVTEIYGSREQPIEGVTSELVVEAARHSGHRNVQTCRDVAHAAEILDDLGFGPGDVVLTLGAGDVYRWGRELAVDAAAEVRA